MRNEMIQIGGTIKQRRELLGLLQADLAKIAGTSTRTLQLVEMGKANPSLDTLLKITGALGLDITVQLKNLTSREDGNQ